MCGVQPHRRLWEGRKEIAEGTILVQPTEAASNPAF